MGAFRFERAFRKAFLNDSKLTGFGKESSLTVFCATFCATYVDSCRGENLLIS